MKIGDWTNHGRLLFIDRICESIPDPLVKVSKSGFMRLSELMLEDEPQSEIDRKLKIKELKKEREFLSNKILLIDHELSEL